MSAEPIKTPAFDPQLLSRLLADRKTPGAVSLTSANPATSAPGPARRRPMPATAFHEQHLHRLAQHIARTAKARLPQAITQHRFQLTAVFAPNAEREREHDGERVPRLFA